MFLHDVSTLPRTWCSTSAQGLSYVKGRQNEKKTYLQSNHNALQGLTFAWSLSVGVERNYTLAVCFWRRVLCCYVLTVDSSHHDPQNQIPYPEPMTAMNITENRPATYHFWLKACWGHVTPRTPHRRVLRCDPLLQVIFSFMPVL